MAEEAGRAVWEGRPTGWGGWPGGVAGLGGGGPGRVAGRVVGGGQGGLRGMDLRCRDCSGVNIVT